MKRINERKIGKRRNPFWINARGINLVSTDHKPSLAQMLIEDDFAETKK